MSQVTRPPLAPRAATLPFSELPWERFEQLAHDLLLALPGMRPETAHRYGTQGQAQRGIDLIVQRADDTWWAFSNKRYKKYQPHHVRDHIADTTYRADRYIILISGIASADVRDEVRKHPGWELWDEEDLSQRIRLELTSEFARRLVDHHFGPVWRRDFLGLPAVGAFIPPADYFRTFLDSDRLFHHALPLVGRRQLVDSLTGFADGQGRERVLLLPGRGGIGKTRLLRELTEGLDAAHPDRVVRLLNDGVPLTLDALGDLPPVPTLVVVDDAHRRTDLGPLLAWLRQRPDGRLLLATRPQGADYLLVELTRAGIDASQIRRVPLVERLTRDEVHELARHVLGPDHEDLADRLARVTRDCPLVTVVGGRLLAGRAVPPELLERDADFRQEVLNRFRDETLGRVSEAVPPELCKRLLEVVAALNPIPPDPGPTHDRLATFLGVQPPDVTRALGELERVGLLVRRGQLVRLTPDVLADHILHSACLTPQGVATRFADQVFEAFAGEHLAQLLRNLAELDWRVRAGGDRDPDLLNRVWGQIREAFRAGGHRERVELLGLLGDSAYFLPDRVLELARFAVRNPASPEAEEVIPGWLSYSHANVLRAVPDLLRRCSVSASCLPVCLDLLWELDRSDDRPTNPNPDHPFRVLIGIAEYGMEKPLWVNAAVLDAACRWLTRPDAFSGRHTPLDVLDQLLAKSGIEHDSDGRRIRMRPFVLDYESVRGLREQVLTILTGCLAARDIRVVLRAVRSLGAVLDGPAPYLGMEITDEVLKPWQDEQLHVLDVLQQLVAGHPPPVVLLAVLREVRFHAHDGRLAPVRERAAALIRSIDQSFDFRLTRLLLPEMSRWDLFEEELDGVDDLVELRDARHRELARSVVTEFWRRFPDPPAVVAELDRLLRELRPVESDAEAGNLMGWLLDDCPAAVRGIADQLVRCPSSPAAESLGVVLSRLLGTSPADVMAVCREALDTGVLELRRVVARFCQWGLRAEAELHDDEPTLYDRLIADTDPFVHRAGVAALRRLARFRPRDAINRTLAIDPGADAATAVELCRLGEADRGGVPESLTDGDIAALLGKLDAVERIDSQLTGFLRLAWGRTPQAVVELFFRRIDREWQLEHSVAYRAVPSEPLSRSVEVLAESADHPVILRRIRDHALGADGGPQHALGDLYRHVALGFRPVAVDVLAEWFHAGDERQLRAAVELLRLAPRSLVFDRLDLISRILERAEAFGDDCLSAVARVLYGIASLGSRQGVPGQPFPVDIQIRDWCNEALTRVRPGSVTHRFLTEVLRGAEHNIREASLDEDE
jgi:hypothetical protein